MSILLFPLLLSEPAAAIEIPHRQLQLDNGLNVILHHDDRLPQVVVNVWVQVGSADEAPGRSGFAHLFEHLMFMGTARVPEGEFDSRMEGAGGWNNAWTSEDATDYYDVGPSNLTQTLLWMEADRFSGLAAAMTTEKLDLQRDVVRNERRQGHEDEPYGELWLVIPGAMYPAGHPYSRPVIGSHEDLQAATVEDVVAFFGQWYVPSNASLVVAGDFDEVQIEADVRRLFGPLPARPAPERLAPPVPDLPITPLVELTDEVQVPMSTLLWHTPAVFADGDAALDFVASIAAGGRSSRLYQRLVHEEATALTVDAGQLSQRLSSVFLVQLMPTEAGTLEDLEAAVSEELARLAADGPTDEELERTRNQIEVMALRDLESLQGRASQLNHYWALIGDPGGLEKDLERYRSVTAGDVKAAAALLSDERRAVVRIRPESAPEDASAPESASAPEDASAPVDAGGPESDSGSEEGGAAE